MRSIAYLVMLLTGISTISVKPAVSDELPIQVGMVIYQNARSDHYKLKRRNHDLTVTIAMVLQNEDVLTIDCGLSDADPREEISIILQLTHINKKLTCKDSPYTINTVKGNNRDITISNFVDWASGVIAASLESMQSKPYAAIVRGNGSNLLSHQSLPLYMPLICRSGGRMIAGRSELHIAWIGGQPPYRLQLQNEDKLRVQIKQEGMEESTVTLHDLELLPDSYELLITDAHGRALKRFFQVVDPESLPAPKHGDYIGVEDPRLKPLRETAYAAWLSDQDRGVWTLEAYQRVADVALDYDPAELMRRKLAEGL